MGGRQWNKKGGPKRAGEPPVGTARNLTSGEEVSCGGTKRWILIHLFDGRKVLLQPIRAGSGKSWQLVNEIDTARIVTDLERYWSQ